MSSSSQPASQHPYYGASSFNLFPLSLSKKYRKTLPLKDGHKKNSPSRRPPSTLLTIFPSSADTSIRGGWKKAAKSLSLSGGLSGHGAIWEVNGRKMGRKREGQPRLLVTQSWNNIQLIIQHHKIVHRAFICLPEPEIFRRSLSGGQSG